MKSPLDRSTSKAACRATASDTSALPSFGRRAVDQLRPQIAPLTKAGAAQLDYRRPQHRVGRSRRWRGSGATVRRLGNAGDPRIARRGPDEDWRPKGRWLRSRCRSRCSSTPARRVPRRSSPPRCRATSAPKLIGERTLGRTGVQELVKLPDGSGLWITSSRYLHSGRRAAAGQGPRTRRAGRSARWRVWRARTAGRHSAARHRAAERQESRLRSSRLVHRVCYNFSFCPSRDRVA